MAHFDPWNGEREGLDGRRRQAQRPDEFHVLHGADALGEEGQGLVCGGTLVMGQREEVRRIGANFVGKNCGIALRKRRTEE